MGVGAREIEMKAGDGLLLRPGQDHALLEASSDLELFVLALTPEVAARCVGQALPSGVARSRLDGDELEWVRGHLDHLSSVADPTRHETFVGELFTRTAGAVPPEHPVARKALEHVVRDPSSPWWKYPRASAR